MLVGLWLISVGAWADTTVLSCADINSITTHTDSKGIITVTDAKGSTGIQLGSASYPINGYTPMKLSGSRQFNITYNPDVTINKVTLYALSNKDDGTVITLGYDSDNKDTYGQLPQRNDTPGEYNFTGRTGIYATGQFLAIIVVDYTKNEGGGDQPGGGDDEPGDVELKEKVVYQTNFQNWTKSSANATGPVFVTQTTTDNQELTFELFNTAVDPEGTNSKFTSDCCTVGYLQTNKDKEGIAMPYIELSPLKSITKLEIVQAATGGTRGITVAVKGEGDNGWTYIHSAPIVTQAGETLTFDVNRTNCQIMIGSYKPAENAYVLSMKIHGMVEVPARTFKDFKIDFRTETPTIMLPESGELPQGVEVVLGTYKDGQHGTMNTKVTVPVDGPVKFTIGACQYTSKKATVTINGETTKTIENKTACDGGIGSYNNFVTYVYNVEAPATLVFDLGQYCPYFFAEACEFTPSVTVDYYNTDGKLIGSDVVDGGSPLAYKYGVSDVTVESGKAFRGWFDGKTSAAVKVPEGKELLQDLKLYAKATDIEVATVGSSYVYELNKANFYPEDHELFSTTGKFNDTQHGYGFSAGQSLSVQTAGNAVIVLGRCKYANQAAEITVTDGSGNTIATFPAYTANDGETATIKYFGEPTTVTATMSGTAYIHKVEVYNVNEVPEKNEAGYFVLAPGDGAGLQLVLAQLQESDKIFLPNGTYDFGEKVLTTISANNVSIIGESAEGTIIRNCPPVDMEGLGKADLLLNTSTGLYLQDLTLKNDLDYIKAGSAGRAAAFHDQGTQTILKNVNLRSHQDTYYSHKVGGLYYFDGGILQGTVDYLCGNGKAYFNGCTLFNKARKSGDTMTANSELYVFNNCTVECEDDETPYNFGRAWSDNPACVFLNTTLKDGGAKLISTRWTLAGINCDYSVAGEYGTKNAEGEDITPASNNVVFTKANTAMNTILDAVAAAEYSINYTLGDWAETAQDDAAQVTDPKAGTVFLVDGVITTVCPASGEVRVANSRGGFGPKVDVATVISNANAAVTSDAPAYNLVGQRVSNSAKGIVIKNGKKIIR